MIRIDGSSGGGSVLRNSLALSMILKEPFSIENIRKSRPSPGLKHQHMAGVKAAQKISGAEVKGCTLGSRELTFIPGELKPGEYEFDIGTAGSITLLLQAILPPCLSKGEFKFTVKGGTDVKWSPPFDYFKNVFLPHVNAEVDARLVKRGYYPKGGGEIVVKVKPKQNRGKIKLVETGKLRSIKGISHASSDLRGVAERQAKAAQDVIDCKVESTYSDTLSKGSGIVLWAEFENTVIGADSLGERGKPAERVGREAAKRMKKKLSYPVDEFLADQLIIFLGLFGGEIKTPKITDHVKNNIYVAEKFLDSKFEIKHYPSCDLISSSFFR